MSRTGTAMAVVASIAVGVAAIAWGPALLEGQQRSAPSERCTVTQGDLRYSLTAEQANNAALIAAQGPRQGLGVHGVTVALATAIQESSLRNLDYGDRDSLGLFQQRPSQGWGTVEQVTDPYYSTQTFYAALLKVSGWENLAITDAAQAVQRSGFPLAYADHEVEADAWARAFLTGEGFITCSIAGPAVATPQRFAERLAADFGAGSHAVDVLERDGDQTILGVRPGSDTEQARSALAAWAVATAWDTGVTWVASDSLLVTMDGSWEAPTPTIDRDRYAGIRVAVASR